MILCSIVYVANSRYLGYLHEHYYLLKDRKGLEIELCRKGVTTLDRIGVNFSMPTVPLLDQ